MSDLISRQAAIEAVRKIGGALASITTDGHETILIDKAAVQTELMLLPPSEPKKGKWKPFDLTWGRSVWACDACGETVDVPTLNGKPIFDYCPWCGARMDEVSDEHTD